MTLVDSFVHKITPEWENMLDLPFLKGIINGNLEKGHFLKYLIQDTIYLKHYAKCYAYAITKTQDITVMRMLYDCLGIIAKDESMIHIVYLKELNCTEDEALLNPMHKINEAYLNYMLEFAKTGTLAQSIMCLVPCALSYYYIAVKCKEKSVALKTYENNYYKKWMDFYSSAGYKESCNLIQKLCQIVLKKLEREEINELYKIFKTSTHHEKLFWNIPFM